MGKPEGEKKNHLEDLGIEENKILKYVFKNGEGDMD